MIAIEAGPQCGQDRVMSAFQMDHSRCGRCHRALKNEQSRRRGYGRICWGKVGGREDEQNLMDSLPRTITDSAAAQAAFSELTQQILQAVGDSTCRCGERLDAGDVGSYDHDGGLSLPGFGKAQWVYLKCKCGHCLAAHHIRGLER